MRILMLALAALWLAPEARAQTAPAPTPALAWATDLDAALQQAKTAQRPVLAVFSGSDWCKPCIQLKQEVFDQPAFAQFAQGRYVLAHFDFPRSRKHRLSPLETTRSEQAAARFNKAGEFPLVLLLAPDGRVLARGGYRPGGAAAYVAYLQTLPALAGASPSK